MINNFNVVQFWWISLALIALLNIGLWLRAMYSYKNSSEEFNLGAINYRLWHLWLSAIYVAGCAFRSFVPRVDVQRFVLYDDWLSNVFLGRSVATIAELCFAIQWALVLKILCENSESSLLRKSPALIIVLIVIAEIFSWYSVISTNFMGHIIEESIWALSTLCIMIILSILYRSFESRIRQILFTLIIVSFGYFMFMVTIDIPMYFSRWQLDESSGVQYLAFMEGLSDLHTRWIVTFDWQDWKYEAPWMSLYFSVGVWVSIYFVNAAWNKTRNK